MKLRYKILSGVCATLLLGIAILAIILSYESACPTTSLPAVTGASMRAVVLRCYGPPSVLKVERIAKPAPRDNEVLIKVHAASVNPFEWHMTTGKPYVLRLKRGISKPKGIRLGNDFAGTVEAVGAKVTRFKPGDEVFGSAGGALAEYVRTPEGSKIVLRPANVSFEQAAAIPIAAITALQALRDHGKLVAGQKVLINGASGGVGTYAIQIAKSMGAEVTAVCSTRNLRLVRSLGADHVVDYTREDFTKGSQRYDLIVDNVGNHGFLALADVVNPTGAIVTVSGPKENPWLGPLARQFRGKIITHFIDQKLVSFLSHIDSPDLQLLAGLMREGKLRTAIDRRYPLEQTADALEYIGTRRAQGKVIVTFD